MEAEDDVVEEEIPFSIHDMLRFHNKPWLNSAGSNEAENLTPLYKLHCTRVNQK